MRENNSKKKLHCPSFLQLLTECSSTGWSGVCAAANTSRWCTASTGELARIVGKLYRCSPGSMLVSCTPAGACSPSSMLEYCVAPSRSLSSVLESHAPRLRSTNSMLESHTYLSAGSPGSMPESHTATSRVHQAQCWNLALPICGQAADAATIGSGPLSISSSGPTSGAQGSPCPILCMTTARGLGRQKHIKWISRGTCRGPITGRSDPVQALTSEGTGRRLAGHTRRSRRHGQRPRQVSGTRGPRIKWGCRLALARPGQGRSRHATIGFGCRGLGQLHWHFANGLDRRPAGFLLLRRDPAEMGAEPRSQGESSELSAHAKHAGRRAPASGDSQCMTMESPSINTLLPMLPAKQTIKRTA